MLWDWFVYNKLSIHLGGDKTKLIPVFAANIKSRIQNHLTPTMIMLK